MQQRSTDSQQQIHVSYGVRTCDEQASGYPGQEHQYNWVEESGLYRRLTYSLSRRAPYPNHNLQPGRSSPYMTTDYLPWCLLPVGR